MGRKKVQRTKKYNSYLEEFGRDVLKVIGKSIWCIACDEEIKGAFDRKSNIEQHLRTVLHQSKTCRKRTAEQATLDSLSSSESKQSRFNKCLCKALVETNIPLYKTNAFPLRQFLREWTNMTVPDESNLRKFYLPPLYDKHLTELREHFAGKLIWVAMDETRDKTGRAVGAVVAGVLDPRKASKPRLIHMESLEVVNHQTAAAMFNNSLMVCSILNLC